MRSGILEIMTRLSFVILNITDQNECYNCSNHKTSVIIAVITRAKPVDSGVIVFLPERF